MQAVANFLTANGFDVTDVGDAHVTISAPSKPRKKFGIWVTKETDALYQLLAGRTEPQPGSLPHDSGLFESTASEIAQDETPRSKNISSLNDLADWLDDLKEQKRRTLQHLQHQHADLEEEHRVIQAEIALIERILFKIQAILAQGA